MSLSTELDYSKPTLARHVIVLQPVDVEDLGEILDAEVTEDSHHHSWLLACKSFISSSRSSH